MQPFANARSVPRDGIESDGAEIERINEATGPRPLLLLDPWGTDYDSSIQLDSAEEASIAGEIDPTIETTEWEPISASDVSVPELHFVDGVRRTDARVLSLRTGRWFTECLGPSAPAPFERMASERRSVIA